MIVPYALVGFESENSQLVVADAWDHLLKQVRVCDEIVQAFCVRLVIFVDALVFVYQLRKLKLSVYQPGIQSFVYFGAFPVVDLRCQGLRCLAWRQLLERLPHVVNHKCFRVVVVGDHVIDGFSNVIEHDSLAFGIHLFRPSQVA